MTIVIMLWLAAVSLFNSVLAFRLGFGFTAYLCLFSTCCAAFVLLLAVFRVFRFVVVPRDFEAKIVAKHSQEDRNGKSRGSEDRGTQG